MSKKIKKANRILEAGSLAFLCSRGRSSPAHPGKFCRKRRASSFAVNLAQGHCQGDMAFSKRDGTFGSLIQPCFYFILFFYGQRTQVQRDAPSQSAATLHAVPCPPHHTPSLFLSSPGSPRKGTNAMSSVGFLAEK